MNGRTDKNNRKTKFIKEQKVVKSHGHLRAEGTQNIKKSNENEEI